MKLTKEEADNFNKASRLNDIQRWRDMDFVVGYEIKTSNNPKHRCDLCERLKGKYPKSFYWQGWHKHCHCYIVPILMDKETQDKNTRNELHSALYGVKLPQYKAMNQIHYLPKSFIDWFMENRTTLAKDTTPHEYIDKNINLIMESYEYYYNQSC